MDWFNQSFHKENIPGTVHTVVYLCGACGIFTMIRGDKGGYPKVVASGDCLPCTKRSSCIEIGRQWMLNADTLYQAWYKQ